MAKKASVAAERGSPSRSTSETSTFTGKSQRHRPVEAAAGQETRVPKARLKSLGKNDVVRFDSQGFFVSFDYSSDALSEIESFFKRSHKVIVALTVQEILDEHIAKKLA